MGIGATFFTPCSPQNTAPQGGAPRRDGLRPSPWLRHGPCGASPPHTPYKKSDPRFFRRSDFSVIPVWWGVRPHPTSMEFRIYSNISHCVPTPSPISGVRVSRIISSPVSIQ